MKTTLTLILFFLTACFGAMAQREPVQRTSFSKEVTTDGQQLTIRMEVSDQHRSFRYHRSFDVSALSEAEAKTLENHVVDSLETIMRQPVRSVQTSRRTRTTDNVTCQQELTGKASRSAAVLTTSTTAIPYEESFEENLAEGRIKLRFTFMADGQPNVVERSAIVRDRSERGIQKLREEIKRQLTAEMEELMRTAESRPI